MPYSQLPARNAGDPFDISLYNTIKADFEAGVPDIFTAKGDLAVATGANDAVRLAAGADGCELNTMASKATGLVWQIKPFVRVYIDANVSISAKTWTTLSFTDVRWDSDSMWSAGAPTKLIVPSGGAGVYLIGAGMQWNTADSAWIQDLAIRFKVGGTVAAQQAISIGQQDDIAQTLTLQTVYQCDENDEVICQVYAKGGQTVLAQPAYSGEFWMMWLRAAV